MCTCNCNAELHKKILMLKRDSVKGAHVSALIFLEGAKEIGKMKESQLAG